MRQCVDSSQRATSPTRAAIQTLFFSNQSPTAMATPSIITKRDGSTAPFDAGRITAALERAFAAAQSSHDCKLIEDLTASALDQLKPFRQPTVELVQDAAVCALLMHNPPLYSVVKAYALYRAARARSRALQLSQATDKTVRRLRADVPVHTPWGPLGYLTYARTYARRIEGTARAESFPDTIARVLSAAQKQLGVGFTDAELERAWHHMLSLKGSVAGRMLWQLNTRTVDRLGLASTQNCAFVCVSSLRAFTWAMELLMLGSGVGFSVQRRYVDQLPPVLDARVKIRRHDVPDADYIVADSREGWVGLLEEVLDAYFNTGKSFTYNASLIRPAGSPIKGFGGISGGAASLVAGITHICEVLDKARGRKLTSVQVLDTMNVIGTIVAGGNVRRSAQIAIGDPDDVDYLRAKRWDLGDIPNWRSQSNNSVVVSSLDDLHDEFWAGYEGKGEAYGLINLELMRKVGRLADGDKYPDPDVNGVNPCSEQGLADYETCCLAELFLPNINSYAELEDVAIILFRICKHSLLLPCHLPETASVVRRNMRMGIGVTGVLQASEEQRSWLPALYERLRAYDAAYSDAHGMARSVKLTTTKPSGCARPDTLTVTSKGILQLDEIGNVCGEQWQLLPQDMRIAGEASDTPRCTKFFVNSEGAQVATKKITMVSGGVLECTPQHRYRVFDASIGKLVWKHAEDLVPGDIVPYELGSYLRVQPTTYLPLATIKKPKHCKLIQQPDLLDEDIGWLMGFYAGDGSNHKRGIRISGSITKMEALLRAQAIVRQKFAFEANILQDKGKDTKQRTLYANSIMLKAWLDANGLTKQPTHEVEIPLMIRQSPASVVKAYTDGFWAADGCREHIRRDMRTYCTTSEKMAYQLLACKRAIGEACTLRLMPPTATSWGTRMRYWINDVRAWEGDYPKRVDGQTYKQFERCGLTRFVPDEVKSVADSTSDTYDLEVPAGNAYIAGAGYVSHNTLSLLAGVTPGWHPSLFRYYVRRIRIASCSPLIGLCRAHGYHVEPQQRFDGTLDRETFVVEFPCATPEGVPVAEDLKAVDQLEVIRRLQTEWSDNAVSNTVYYQPEELPAIKEWLKANYSTSVKTFSAMLQYGHGFAQAPYSPLSREEYESMAARVRPMTDLSCAELMQALATTAEDDVPTPSDQPDDSLECGMGGCPVR
jgi:hypothetical protein